MKKIRFLLYTILSVSLLILVVSLMWNSWYQKEGIGPEGLSLTKADMSLGAVHFTENRKGVNEWELTAEDVQYFKDKGIMLFTGVKILLLSGGSGGHVTMEGQEGRFDTDSGDIEVSGNVVVTSSEGHRLYTNFLTYKSDGEMITTESEVSLLGHDIIVRGKGLSMDVKNNKFAILSNVHTEIKGGFQYF